jgi:hypothetical protein
MSDEKKKRGVDKRSNGGYLLEHERELREPLAPTEAKALIRQVILHGEVRFSRHALGEMAHDPLGPISKVDVVNVLRGGVVGPGELRSGTWRYPERTALMAVVVAFRGVAVVITVTAWREKR